MAVAAGGAGEAGGVTTVWPKIGPEHETKVARAIADRLSRMKRSREREKRDMKKEKEEGGISGNCLRNGVRSSGTRGAWPAGCHPHSSAAFAERLGTVPRISRRDADGWMLIATHRGSNRRTGFERSSRSIS
jgi:hypothetical protein